MSPTILAVATTLTVAFGSTLAWALRCGKDPFSPWCLVPGLHLLRTSPYLFLLSTDPHRYSHQRIAEHFPDLDSAYLWYGFVELLGFAAIMAGICSNVGPGVARRLPLLCYRMRLQTCYLAAGAAITLGFLAYASILNSVGGLGEMLGGLDRRVEMFEGLGYQMSLTSLAAVGCVMLAYTLKFNLTGPRLALVVFVSLATAAMFSSYGGRKLALGLLLSLLLVWHYAVRPIRRPIRLATILLLIVSPYFVMMPLLRSQRDGVAYYVDNPGELAAEIVENASMFVLHLSYCDTYVFVTNTFTLDNVWMGRTYLDLAKLPVPRRLLHDKPPSDEGVYLYAMANGHRAEPGMPSDDLPGVGWPPETLGIGYANFHLPGVVAFMFALGAIYRGAYGYLLRSRKSLYAILMYQATLFGFQLSNLRISQMLMATAMTTLFFMAFMGGRMRR